MDVTIYEYVYIYNINMIPKTRFHSKEMIHFTNRAACPLAASASQISVCWVSQTTTTTAGHHLKQVL